MKKFLTSLFVVLLVCVSAVTMFACGGGVNKDELFKQVDAVVTKIDTEREEKGMLLHRVDLGLESDYALDHYSSDPVYNYYNRLFVVAMNYIKNNYSSLQKLDKIEDLSAEGQDAVNRVGSSATNFEVNYDVCVNNFETYKNLSVHGNNEDVLNGALTIYRISLKSLMTSAFDLANAIADVKDYVFDDFGGLQNTNAELSTADSVTLRDYAVLKSANMFYQTLVQNLNMKDFTSNTTGSLAEINEFVELNRNIKSGLQDLIRLQAKSGDQLQVFTGEKNKSDIFENKKVTVILDAIKLMENENKLLQKAQENFNLELYFETYSCNLDAYGKDLQYASKYFNEIERYYQSYVQNYIDYMSGLIVAGV